MSAVKRLKPLFDRVLVQRAEVIAKIGSVYVPETAQSKMSEGTVIATGPGARNQAGETVKMSVKEGDKVLLIDDLVATGGTLCSGIELIKACGGEVTECGCMVELKFLKGRDRCIAAGAKSVWAFMSEEILTTKAALPAEYVDDGEAH